ncbi:MAG: hypothetical protein ACI923_001548 [Flavobacteriales bacterium]|jgi:hypothetical protein
MTTIPFIKNLSVTTKRDTLSKKQSLDSIPRKDFVATV